MESRIVLFATLVALMSLTQVTRSQDGLWEYCGNEPADVAFLLDSSNSIWGPDFRRQINFVEDVVSMFQIGENATRVGLVTYNDHVNMQFNLKRYFDKDALLQAIRNVRESHGYSTATDLVLKYTRNYLFKHRGGGRSNVAKVAVVITDGKSRNMLRTMMEAARAKRQGVHLFAIGVGHAVNYRELSRMASQPSSEYFFQVAGYTALDSLKRILAIKTCQVSRPPTPRLTTPTTTRTTTTTTTPTTTTTTPTTTTTTTTTPAPTTTTTTLAPTTPTLPTTILTTPEPTTTTTTPTTTTTTPTTTTTTPTTTTTTVPTTSTIPESTTTTWVDVVRKACKGKMVDIVFALDNSDAVTHNDFWQMIRFVRDFARGLDIHNNGTRIGVELFSDQVHHGFDLNEHDNIHGLVSHLYKLQMAKGDARIDELIRFVRTTSFRRTVSRKGAAQVVIMLMASHSVKLYKTKRQALKARKTGLTFLVIGVGKKVNEEELRIITGPGAVPETDNVQLPPLPNMDADSAMMMDELMMAGGEGVINNVLGVPHVPTPPPAPRSPLFRLDSFTELDSVLLDAVLQTCEADPTDNPVSDQPCGTRQEADMMFVVDSANAGKKNTKKAMDFMKSITSTMEINRDQIQVGMVAPDPCAPATTNTRRRGGRNNTTNTAHAAQSFRLNQHGDKDNLVNSLDSDTSDFSSLVRDLRKTAFRHRSGARKGAKRIAILIVDGDLDDPLSTLTEAQKIRDKKGVEIYVISVGTTPPQPEMMMMCAFPPQKHFYRVDNYDKLGDMRNELVDLLCDEL